MRDNPNEFGVDRATLTPEQRTGLVTEPHLPQKFRRPLPQPGDFDYVAGQPVNEEEAQRMEQVEQDRYDYAIKAGKDAEANRAPDEALDKQHPASPPPRGTLKVASRCTSLGITGATTRTGSHG